jgi:tellurite resistance protein
MSNILDHLIERTRIETTLSKEEYDELSHELTEEVLSTSEVTENSIASSNENGNESVISSPSSLDLGADIEIIPAKICNKIVHNEEKLVANLRLEIQRQKQNQEKMQREYQLKISQIEHSYEVEKHNAELEIVSLKSKLETINSSFTQASSDLKQSQSENKVLRKKVEVLKNAYYKLQTESEKRIARLETQLEALSKTEEISKLISQLEETIRPHNSLVLALEKKDQIIEKQQLMINNMEDDIKRYKEENEKLISIKQSLERDLEQMLNQKEVINKLKSVLLNKPSILHDSILF